MAFQERLHPRDGDGKFASGGSEHARARRHGGVDMTRSSPAQRAARFAANRANDLGPGDAVHVKATGQIGSVTERIGTNRARVLLDDGREYVYQIESLRLAEADGAGPSLRGPAAAITVTSRRRNGDATTEKRTPPKTGKRR